jgi:flagellar biosynthesis/type III secretory pathway protein FliH
MKDWKFNQSGISKEDLPLMVEINGVTYYSSLKMAKVHNAWYEMGVDDGKSMANSGLTRSDAQNSNEYMKGYEEGKSEGYDNGYNDGYEQCKHDEISKINLNTKSIEQTELSKEYDKGFTKGYEEGKSEGYKLAQVEGVANGYTDSDIVRTQEQWYRIGYEAGKKEEYHPIDSDNDHYQTGYNHGKSIGYNNGKTDAMREAYNIAITPDFIKGYNQAKGELEHQIQKKYKEGYADGKTDGYKESYHEATIEKVAQFNKGYEIGSYTASKEEVYQKGYEAGKKDEYMKGYCDGYEQCKHDGISAKEIQGKEEHYDEPKEEPSTNTPGIKVSNFDKVWMEVYKAGYDTGREFAEHILKSGRDTDGVEEPEDDYCKDCKEEPQKTSKEWQEIYPNPKVLDPDGWDRQNFQFSWFEEEITFDEYKNRVSKSTVKGRIS